MSAQLSRSRRTLLALVTGATVIGVVTACNPADGGSVATAPKSAAAGSATAKGSGGDAAAAKPAVAKVGDTISLKGFDTKADITVVKVVDKAAAKDEFSTPDAGNRFVAVQFRIKVTGSKAYSDSPANGAKLADSSGQQYEADYNDTKAGQSFPGSVDIAPGGTALGFITFQVPKSAKISKIQFGLDSGMADQTGQWTVG